MQVDNMAVQTDYPTNQSLRATSHIRISAVGGKLDVVYYAAERKSYGTREDKKAGGDAEAAARQGGHETANAQTGAEMRAVFSTSFKTFPHEVPSTKPVALPLSTRYVTYCNM